MLNGVYCTTRRRWCLRVSLAIYVICDVLVAQSRAQEEIPISAAGALVPHQLTKRMNLELCLGQFDVHQNTIIRTGESQAIGGKYLQGIELENMDECQRLCCETELCDVYIFESKSGGYCYLFECGPPENFHCKFTRHANYTSAVLITQVRQPPVASTPKPIATNANKVSQQELELTNLKAKPVPKPPSTVLASVPATKTTAVQCGRFQFACHSGECIAIYNACDGIPQCEDGSDEGPECNGMPAAASTVVNQQQKQQEQRKANVESATAMNKPISNNQYQVAKPQQQQHRQPSISQVQAPAIPALAINNLEYVNKPDQQLLASQPQPRVISTGGAQDMPPALPAYVNGRANSAKGNANANLNPMYPLNVHGSGLYFLPMGHQQQEQSQDGSPIVNSGLLNQAIMPPNTQWSQQPLPQALPAAKADHGNVMTAAHQVPAQQNSVLVKPMEQQMVPPAMANAVQTDHTSAKNGPSPPSSASAAVGIAGAPPAVKAAAVDANKSNAEYEDYEEQSTVAPRKKHQRKRKKVQAHASITSDAKEPVVHEQYRFIHENLALEVRDHDGYSERPTGAMLSMILGALATVVLAIFYSCRMRTVTRRVRRLGGKAPFSQEADFLVNGMYL